MSLAIFKAEFLRCCDVLAMGDWDVTFKVKKLKDAFAEIDPDYPAHMVTVRVDTHRKADEATWKRYARHEAIHLFTAPLRYLAESRYVTEEQLDTEEERLAVVGEKLALRREHHLEATE